MHLFAARQHQYETVWRIVGVDFNSLYGTIRSCPTYSKIWRFNLVFLRFNIVLSTAIVILCLSALAITQAPSEKPVEKKPTPTPVSKAPEKPVTAEQIADAAIFIYGFGGGRITLDQIRKTTTEKGKITFTASDGKSEQATYQRTIVRGASLATDKIRLDQEFSNARYSLVFNDDKIFGLFNNNVFTPREDASKAFENSIFRGLEMLLRYKEDESKIELAGKEKQLGVEFFMIDVTDKKGRQARFYVSVKSYRVMALTYEDGGVKYKRKFYNHNYAQGTLVASRSVLFANDKVVEETEIGTITFGQKVDEDLFKATR